METDDMDSVCSDDMIYIRVAVPELSIQKCIQFHRSDLVGEVKQQCLASLPKDLKEGFNYGLFMPPQNSKAGKFLDEARPIADYPFTETVGLLELKYKRRVYKMLKLDEKQLKALHNRANLRRFLEYICNGHVDKVAKMCAKGMDPNFHCPETGETPLTLCAGQKSPARLIMTLANGGAILDFRNRDGATAVHKAVEKNNYEALKTLMELGASPNYQDTKSLTPLYYSIVHNADPTITLALLHDHAVTGAQDSQGWTETHQAARRSMTQHLEHLLFYGANMNSRNASGNTALHVCAINNEEACARVLLFRGADTQALNYANQTPYQVAVIASNLKLADVIKEHRVGDIVAFKDPPKYNPRRRSTLISGVPRTHSESGLSSPISKPPSPSPSDRSMAPFSSASSLSDGSSVTGSGGGTSRLQTSVGIISVKDQQLDAVSESSGVGTSNGSGSGESCDRIPLAGDSSCTVVCTDGYHSATPGHLRIVPGDIIEVLASTDGGMLEGRADGRVGVFPAHCVQEVRLRHGVGTVSSNRRPSRAPSSVSTATVSRDDPSCSLARGDRVRTVVLQRGRRGFGFVLRGAKATSPLMELHPSTRCPALQYLDQVDVGGVAELAGLCKWDFILAINGVDVSRESHEFVVEQIRRAGDMVAMTVVSVPTTTCLDGTAGARSLPRKLSCMSVGSVGRPVPPPRDPRTALSVGRARARSIGGAFSELEALDAALHEYDSEGRSTNSSSLESDAGRPSAERVASIRSRAGPTRLTPRELEELFARQGSAPQFPLTAGQGGPRVYASVAEMKRHKGKKQSKQWTVEAAGAVGLTKDFHSTPDLLQQVTSSAGSSPSSSFLPGGGPSAWSGRRSHSQEDLHALQHGPGARLQLCSSMERLSCQLPAGKKPRSGRRSRFAPPTRRVQSSFRPTDDAKLYAAPAELRSVALATATLPRRSSALSATPTSSETTPTNQEPAEEELPPPPASLLRGTSPTPPPASPTPTAYTTPTTPTTTAYTTPTTPTPSKHPQSSPAATTPSDLGAMLKQKLAERQRRLSLAAAERERSDQQWEETPTAEEQRYVTRIPTDSPGKPQTLSIRVPSTETSSGRGGRQLRFGGTTTVLIKNGSVDASTRSSPPLEEPIAPPPEFSDTATPRPPAPSTLPKPAASQSPARRPQSLDVPCRSTASGIPRPVTSPPQRRVTSFSQLPVAQWSSEQVAGWLESLQMSEHRGRFLSASVDGPRLLLMDSAALAELGVRRMAHRINIQAALKRLIMPR